MIILPHFHQSKINTSLHQHANNCCRNNFLAFLKQRNASGNPPRSIQVSKGSQTKDQDGDEEYGQYINLNIERTIIPSLEPGGERCKL